MATYDVIEAALNAPIDWAVFEKMVAEILAQDDMPHLRRAGGYKDSGVDAYETALFVDESNADTIVQITSQRAQTVKVETTLTRLRECRLAPNSIVFVFRHPVSSTVRNNILKQTADVNIKCDVRDQSYLMMQLGKNTTGLFSRYFESVKSQFAALLSSPDPLETASDRLRHALLLSVASYVVHPKSRLVRRALFIKTTLAALVACGSARPEQLVEPIQQLAPEEDITIDRVAAALAELEKAGECEKRDGAWHPSTACVAQFSSTMGAVRKAYDDMIASVTAHCGTPAKGDQATLGIVERNARRALLRLLRVAGPFGKKDEDPVFWDESALPEIRACLSQDLKDNVARHVVIAFGAYIEDPDHVPSLSLFARSYSALALRNIDPLGRRWQQVALQRSLVALDTDALLTLLIKELPEHPSLRKSLEALSAQGTSIIVTPRVVEEATGHISRAQRTFNKFCAQIDRFSPAMADAYLWHAVVRGYYYARKSGYSGDWYTYWNGYYDKARTEDFVRFQLSKVSKCRVEELSEFPAEWLDDHEVISQYIIAEKESHRYKAEFREPEQMSDRVRVDIRMAMSLARHATDSGGHAARGYLVSEDRAFFKAEQHERWAPRGRVAVLTRALPQLAEFACGAKLADDEVVRLLFEPAVVAAAESVGSEIDTLTALGVNLSDVPLGRLEWALEGDLHKALQQFRQDHLTDAKLDGAIGVLTLAEARGLPVDSFVADLALKYQETKKQVASSALSSETANDMLKRVVLALVTTKKSRRRANRILKELGLSLADFEDDDEEPQQ